MKFVCLGYYDESRFAAMPETEQQAFIDECFTYDCDVLQKDGRMIGGEALDSARNAATVRYQNGKVVVTDGPYAETKEQLGGIMLLEADDMAHAIRLISKHPGVKNGPFEIRPAADLSEMIRASERRRAAVK